MTITQSSAAEFTAASISSIVKSQDGANTPLTDIRSSLAPVSGTPSRSTSSNPASACNSAHPSPNGTLTKPPSIDALTPRSVKLYDLEDHVASALRTSKNQEPSDSPFFAGWDASASKGAEPLSTSEQVSPQEDLFDVHEQKSYSLASAAATPSTAPLYASASHTFFEASQTPSASSLLPTLPKLQVATVSSAQEALWSPPMSPLPMDAVAPSAPKLGTLPTPVMSPRGSLPTTPAASYLRSTSPLRTGEVASAAHGDFSIHSLLSVQGKLPLPGQFEDEDITISSALLSQATRSDSVDSISSVLNDTGHDTSIMPEMQNVGPASPSNMGNAFLDAINSPPLQALPAPATFEKALSIPPAKHSSDPPLIPSLQRPNLMHLAGEALTSQQRPVSPFSPTLALFNENPRLDGHPEPAIRADVQGREPDLIDFDSESESALADVHDQYAHYANAHGDAVYLGQNLSTSSFRQSGSKDSPSSSDEDGEEENYISHPLYQILSTSESPYVRRAWEGSRVVLVPPRYTLSNAFLECPKQASASTSLDRPAIWERFAAIHALREEAGSPDQYVGFGATSEGLRLYAKLDSENHQVQVALKPESKSVISPGGTVNDFGVSVRPLSQPLSRHTLSSNTASNQSSAIPPHLLVSSPVPSVESSNFPNTPPLLSDVDPAIASKGSSGSGSTPRIVESVVFPSIEPAHFCDETPLSPTRRLNIVHEKVLYRKRRVRTTVSTSAPSGLASPTLMTRSTSVPANDSESAASAARMTSIQEATDRLSKLSTPSMQSINSIASISTNNGKTVKKRDSKVRLRVPKWLGGRSRDSISGMQVTESAPSTPITSGQQAAQAPAKEEVQLVIEKVRLIQVDSYVMEWPGEAASISPIPRDFRRSLPLSARASQQDSVGRMHCKTSQPLSAISGPPMQDATVRERRSFQYPPFSATVSEEAGDVSSIASVQMASRHSSNASHSSRVSRRSSSALGMKHVTQASSTPVALRDFSNDIAYLLDPPTYLEHFSGLFEQSLKLVIRSSRDFADRFLYIRAHEHEAVLRLRTDVLDQVWQYFADEEAIHGLRHHLLDVFENVIMAFAHDYVYSKTISPSFSHQENAFSSIMDVYRSQSLHIVDYGVSSGKYSETAFAPVVNLLSELCGSGARRHELWEKMPPQSYKRLVQLISETTDSASTVIALLEAKTPLDTIAHLRKAIDELVKATSSSDSGHEEPNRLATDDLIPLISWALVKASAKNLPSLLFYAKSFRLCGTSKSDSEWTIVQFEAAIAYLLTDPLRLLNSSESISPAGESQTVSPVQPIFLRTVSEDSLSPPGRSRRSSIQSLPAEPVRGISRSPSQQTHLANFHKRTLSSLPSTRMAFYQAAGRPSSIVSAVTTEEDEDNAEMGPPAPPRKDSLYGSVDGYDLLSVSTTTSSRQRSTSPPVHRPVAVRSPRRPFHLSHDQLQNPSQPTRIPLSRSQTTPMNNSTKLPSFPNQRASVELSRTGSDASRSGSGDWWGPLRHAVAPGPSSPPIGSEGTMSSRPDSPASPAVKSIDKHSSTRSSFDLERSTSDMGWMEWGRKRLSSMTSSTSLVDSAEGARSIAEQIAEKLAASAARGNAVPTASRSRRKSESAATALNTAQFERGVLDAQASVVADTTGLASAPNFSARSLSTVGSRPRSTLSLSSTSSLDTDASLTKSTNAIPYAGASQSRNSIAGPTSGYIAHSSNLSRSRRFRKELRSANLGSSMALPQLQLDTASASALNTSTGPGSHYSHRPSSSLHLHLDKTASVHLGAPAMYHSHPLSHSSSRLGTTPFSPIQEVAPSLQGYTSSPEQVMRNGPSKETFHKDDSLPPTPRDLASAAGRPWSQPTP